MSILISALYTLQHTHIYIYRVLLLGQRYFTCGLGLWAKPNKILTRETNICMCMHFTTNRWTRRELLTRLLLPVGKPTVTNPTTIPSLQMRDSPRERTACWCCFSPRTLQYTISGQSRPSPSTCRHSRNFELKSQTWESFCCQEE